MRKSLAFILKALAALLWLLGDALWSPKVARGFVLPDLQRTQAAPPVDDDTQTLFWGGR